MKNLKYAIMASTGKTNNKLKKIINSKVHFMLQDFFWYISVNGFIRSIHYKLYYEKII
jgi:hypothetical protein